MKGKAMIMMMCFLAYLASWTAVPRMLQVPVQATSHCCAKTGKTVAHKCPKDTKGDKGCADWCMSCPLCYTMILPVDGLVGRSSMVISSSYGDLPVTYLYGFYADVWRPPNAA